MSTHLKVVKGATTRQSTKREVVDRIIACCDTELESLTARGFTPEATASAFGTMFAMIQSVAMVTLLAEDGSAL